MEIIVDCRYLVYNQYNYMQETDFVRIMKNDERGNLDKALSGSGMICRWLYDII